jgi:hypothetical protein
VRRSGAATIYLIGDSHDGRHARPAARNRERGWGRALPELVGEGCGCATRANGRSTRSFIAEGGGLGAHAAARTRLRAHPSVHNDKKSQASARYTNRVHAYRRNWSRS